MHVSLMPHTEFGRPAYSVETETKIYQCDTNRRTRQLSFIYIYDEDQQKSDAEWRSTYDAREHSAKTALLLPVSLTVISYSRCFWSFVIT